MNRLIVLFSVALVSNFLVGCTQINYKNCESDMACFANALQNNCENAKYSFTTDTGATIDKTITRDNSTCGYASVVRTPNGNKMRTKEIAFPIPVIKCQTQIYSVELYTFSPASGKPILILNSGTASAVG